MAGKVCPNCGKLTFFETPTGRKCTKCGCAMQLPKKIGRGKKCTYCGKQTVGIDQKCTNCGAKYFKKTNDGG